MFSPQHVVAPTDGNAVDFGTTPRPLLALYYLGLPTGDSYGTFTIEEADTSGGPWSTVPGSSFGPEGAEGHVEPLTFVPSKRWLRGHVVPSGDDADIFASIAVGVVPFQG